MFFITKTYNQKDRYKNILKLKDFVVYIGNSSVSSYKLEQNNVKLQNTKWLYKTILDSTSYNEYIILLTFDSLIVLNQELLCVYKYKITQKYSFISCYKRLLILWNSKGNIQILHILNKNNNLLFNYPLFYDCGTDISDLEFINNHLYVLGTAEILNLEYSGQFIELIDKINCKGCYKLEQENSSLVLICEDGIHLQEKIFSLNCKIVNCKIYENELYCLNEIGEIHKSNGDIICKIEPSLDFIIVENNGNKLIFTLGEEMNAVYDLKQG